MINFETLPKEKLEIIKLNMESYLQGCMDTFKIIEDIKKNTEEVYQGNIQKINKLLESK